MAKLWRQKIQNRLEWRESRRRVNTFKKNQSIFFSVSLFQGGCPLNSG